MDVQAIIYHIQTKGAYLKLRPEREEGTKGQNEGLILWTLHKTLRALSTERFALLCRPLWLGSVTTIRARRAPHHIFLSLLLSVAPSTECRCRRPGRQFGTLEDSAEDQSALRLFFLYYAILCSTMVYYTMLYYAILNYTIGEPVSVRSIGLRGSVHRTRRPRNGASTCMHFKLHPWDVGRI